MYTSTRKKSIVNANPIIRVTRKSPFYVSHFCINVCEIKKQNDTLDNQENKIVIRWLLLTEMKVNKRMRLKQYTSLFDYSKF